MIKINDKRIFNFCDEETFLAADKKNVLISHNPENFSFGFFEINNNKYYLGWTSNSEFIKPEFLLISNEKYLLIGVDTWVVVFFLEEERTVFSIGLFSYLKYFELIDDTAFCIYTELEDITVNIEGFSIRQIESHDLKL